MKTLRKSKDILNRHLRKLQKENPRFSIRSLSLKVGLSHTFMANVLSGKKLLPLNRLEKLCEVLKIDELDHNELKKYIRLEKSNLTEIAGSEIKTPTSRTKEELLPENHIRVMRYWWNLAILELLSCYPETGLAKAVLLTRIPVQEFELDISLNELRQLQLIRQDKDCFFKTENHLKIPTRGPNPITRQFYKSALTLAQKELDKTQQQDFEKRFITGVSCAVNPSQIPKAKQKLAEALAEIRDILTEGECSEVYFLQAQLFSVLK